MAINMIHGYNPYNYNYIQKPESSVGKLLLQGQDGNKVSLHGQSESKISLPGQGDNRVILPGQEGFKLTLSGKSADKAVLTEDVDGKVTFLGMDDGKKQVFKGEKENIELPGEEDENNLQKEECESCKNRKYQDGSNENVSFKSAQHISPESAAAQVRAHEGEHVANAYAKAEKDDGKVIRASVSIHTDICDECGKVYVSGGTTHTTIRYSGEEVEKPENTQETSEKTE